MRRVLQDGLCECLGSTRARFAAAATAAPALAWCDLARSGQPVEGGSERGGGWTDCTKGYDKLLTDGERRGWSPTLQH